MRAIAVLMVIAFHYWKNVGGEPPTLVGKFAAWGEAGVLLFFVLSGFLITGILLDSKGSPHFFRNFYVRRVLRIFPLYYASLVAVYFIAPRLGLYPWSTWSQRLWFWTYMQNVVRTFWQDQMVGPGHFWSLSVEEHYYFLWPLLVLLLRPRKLLGLVPVAILVSLATRMILFRYHLQFYFTPAQLDGLAIGSAVAILARDLPRGLSRFRGPARAMLLLTVPLLGGLQLILAGRGGAITQVLRPALLSFVFACFLIVAVEQAGGRLLDRILSSRALGSVGRYSYAMYVLHPALLVGVRRLGVPYGFPGLVLTMLATYIGAWMSWHLLEKRFLRLKRFFEYEKGSAPSIAVSA